ncbi:MAG: hypothetical protein A2X56_09675 [Nitrospirae bacterium GWC2_57_13]|nr:MAG: hypothetical protein A2X56_09675 [Nitrospirae bacterium GWC2_57_13]
MNFIIDILLSYNVDFAVLFVAFARPIVLVLILFFLFGCRKKQEEYIPGTKCEIYSVAIVFSVSFVASNLILSYLVNSKNVIFAILMGPPLVRYGTVFISYTLFLLSMLYFLNSNNLKIHELFGATKQLKIFVLIFVLVCLIILYWKLFGSSVGIEASSSIKQEGCANLLSTLLDYFSFGLLIPLAEEFYFRGIVYSSLRNYYKKGIAVVLVSLYFSLAHIPNTLIMILPNFIFGLVYIWLYEKYRSLIPSVLLHGLVNIFVIVR